MAQLFQPPLPTSTFDSQTCEFSTIIISAATADYDANRCGRILRSMQSLADVLSRKVGCTRVSPILQNWPRWHWQLIAELKRDQSFGFKVEHLLALNEFRSLETVAVTDFLILRPAAPNASGPDHAQSSTETAVVPTCDGSRGTSSTMAFQAGRSLDCGSSGSTP